MFQTLFSPVKIKGLELKNRIMLPAMGTKFPNKDRTVSQQLIDYHVERVKGGCGLNMVEVTSVHSPSAPRKYLSLSDDKYIPSLKKLTDAIHKEGGKAGVQLWQGSLAVGQDKVAMILVASDMPVTPEITLPGITVDQIKEIVYCYGAAAKRAVEAGFDCVEVHIAHNYLPHSFLSASINHRRDEYGGSFENRAKFPLEVIRAVKANVPDSMPVFMRIDAHDDYLENGLTIEDVIAFCKLAKEAGVDVLDISRGNIISAGLKYEVPPIDLPKGFNIENAARIKKETGMFTIGVGRINDPAQAEEILNSGKVDMIVIGRGQLADPMFCNKAKAGKIDDIIKCVGCNQGCYDTCEDVKALHITCLRNPALGREKECEIKTTDKPQRVLIAGGGIAGLQAAITLRQRGHNPIICEAGHRLGGQFYLAGEAPRKDEMKQAVIHMGEIAKHMGIEIRLNTPVTKAVIEKIKPDSFINAIGSEEIKLRVPGADNKMVVKSHDVLSGKENLRGNIVVIGGGMVGMETAEYLAEKGCKVTVLEMLPEICADLGSTRKISVMENVYMLGINPLTGVKVTEIKEGSVIGVKDGVETAYPCDYAVAAIGTKSRDGGCLKTACRENNIPYFVIGDAAKGRRAINATREAFDLAITIENEIVQAEAKKDKKTVFLTGGTGTMGLETIRQLLSRSGRFNVRVLARKSQTNVEILKEFMSHPNFEVVWGDMKDYDTIYRCVTGAAYILHIGAMVSPAADKYPEETLRTNIGSTLNIIKAIKAQSNPDAVKFAYIGTVAETGGRTAPIHWGRCGDPVKPSIHDYYGMSKVASEREVFESGLKYWVSIRQTGMHPIKEGAKDEPIIFHQPPNDVTEWSTAIESGITMANLCEDWVDESFWRKAYNLSSGAKWRYANWEFINLNLAPLGLKYEDVYDPRQMAQFNFHGQWYTDSQLLDDYLHFRCVDHDTYIAGMKEEIEAYMANPMIAAMMPSADQMKAINEQIGHKEMGFHWMFENNEEDYIKAFFGSKEMQAEIKSFDEGFKLYRSSEKETYLNHGYDESKPTSELDLDDMKDAAKFRGGECLSQSMKKGDLYTPLKWRCASGHEFEGTPNLILKGGHWCPECNRYEWAYGEVAKENPFFAQVWTPIHGDKCDYKIKKKFSEFDIMKELKENRAE